VTTDQILAGVGLILVLAVGSQVLASRLRIPALIILLPAGFIAGAVSSDVNPERLLGPSFEPLVSLSVAVILYDAGLDLDLRKLRGHTRRIVTRLIVVGVPVTWVIAATCAARLVGMSNRAALMTGVILVVSGPTVVGPLLNTIRPAERLQRVLTWEGSLIDPIGGILGAVVFGAVTTSTRRAPAYQFSQFLLGIGIGIAGGIAGADREPASRRRDPVRHGPALLGAHRRHARSGHRQQYPRPARGGYHGPPPIRPCEFMMLHTPGHNALFAIPGRAGPTRLVTR
jgi:NhaP-type Na+/H+ or K+/H+ antiporter